MSTVAETVEIPVVEEEGVDYARIANSAGFVALRRRFLRFVVPMTAVYITWYLVFVLLAMYEPGIMAVKVTGDLTFGLVMGGLQFVSTFALAARYVRFANTTLDPAAAAIRDGVRAERLGRSQPDSEPRPGAPERPAGHRLWEPTDGDGARSGDRVRGGSA